MYKTDEIDPPLCSLLQKAARRGYFNLVVTLSTLIGLSGSAARRWLKQQAVAMTFRVCWPLGMSLHLTQRYSSKVAALVNTTRLAKNQDAAGLGAMAFALFKNDETVLDGSSQDKEVKLIATAITRPDDFWDWINDLDSAEKASAIETFKTSGTPFDRAIVQAAAYLATQCEPPRHFQVAPGDDRFPYWIAFDHHTSQGRLALSQISRDLHIPISQLVWLFFYYEGSRTQKRLSSIWWDRYCRWRFKKANLVAEQAHLIWSSARPQLIDALMEDAKQLHRDIYRWKKAHWTEVEQLKSEVESFFSSFNRFYGRQERLF